MNSRLPTFQTGFTLVELLVAFALAGVLIAGLNGVIGQSLTVSQAVSEKNELTQQARFAMDQMLRIVSQSHLLLLPLADISSTPLLENIREQTVPPSAPPAGSVLASAVLAVALPASFDLDADGVADADNDADGRIDEDLPADITNDGKSGIVNIDDDGNGIKDFFLSPAADDDESPTLAQNEDVINGIDDDGDGLIDEDPPADNNGDACAGVCGIDDDADGTLDEGAAADDDEDGRSDEDWIDPVVFYLDNARLLQRTPVPWDQDSNGSINGLDFIIEPIADNVSRLRIERLVQPGSRAPLVDIILELSNPLTGESVSLQTRVRVGGGL